MRGAQIRNLIFAFLSISLFAHAKETVDLRTPIGFLPVHASTVSLLKSGKTGLYSFATLQENLQPYVAPHVLFTRVRGWINEQNILRNAIERLAREGPHFFLISDNLDSAILLKKWCPNCPI